MSEESGWDVERIAALEARAKSNTRRIDKLEKSTDALNRLATSVEVMAIKQDQVVQAVDRLDEKVDAIEQKPGKRWDGLADKVVLAVATAFITFLLARLGVAG